MIDKIGRGWDVRGLVRYLMGPGRSNEHTAPTVIGAWQCDPGGLQPGRVGPGDFDFDLEGYSALLDHVNAPAEAAGLPRRQPEQGEPGYTKHGYVWHCSLSLGVEDGALSFARWAEIARDVVDRTGIAPAGDAGGCRWIAVHHGTSTEGNDHIHIAAVLVRQDTGRRFHPRDDFGKTRTVMREWEDRLGLRATAIHDGTAAPAASRGEDEKAQRRQGGGYEGLARGEAGRAARVQLRQVVSETAAVSADGEEFLAGLREQGVLVHLHHNSDGRVDGYAVADPEDRDRRSGQPIYFGGRKLAPELSWRQLERRWTDVDAAPAATEVPGTELRPDEVMARTTAAVRGAVAAVRRRTEPAENIAEGVQVLLSAWARVADGAQRRGDLTRASWDYDRAARAPRTAPRTVAGEVATVLRAATSELSALGTVSGRGRQRGAGVELAVAVTELLVELAAWHERSGRAHHADAAHAAARAVTRFGSETGTGWVGVSVPDVGRARERTVRRPATPTPPVPRIPPPALPPQGPSLR